MDERCWRLTRSHKDNIPKLEGVADDWRRRCSGKDRQFNHGLISYSRGVKPTRAPVPHNRVQYSTTPEADKSLPQPVRSSVISFLNLGKTGYPRLLEVQKQPPCSTLFRFCKKCSVNVPSAKSRLTWFRFQSTPV